MKKAFVFAFAVIMAVVFAACSSAAQPQATQQISQPPQATAAAQTEPQPTAEVKLDVLEVVSVDVSKLYPEGSDEFTALYELKGMLPEVKGSAAGVAEINKNVLNAWQEQLAAEVPLRMQQAQDEQWEFMGATEVRFDCGVNDGQRLSLVVTELYSDAFNNIEKVYGYTFDVATGRQLNMEEMFDCSDAYERVLIELWNRVCEDAAYSESGQYYDDVTYGEFCAAMQAQPSYILGVGGELTVFVPQEVVADSSLGTLAFSVEEELFTGQKPEVPAEGMLITDWVDEEAQDGE